MSTVGVRKKRRKCLNRRESQGNDKATHCPASCLWRSGFISMPGFQEIFKYLESALTSSLFFILWKIPINISPLWILASSGASPRLHCFPPSVIWQRVGLCLVLGTGSLPLALAALGGVDGTRCAVYKRVLFTKTCPAQGPVGPPLKNTTVFPKMFFWFCFILLFPQVWLSAIQFFYLCIFCPDPSYRLCFGCLWLPKVQWSRRLKVW